MSLTLTDENVSNVLFAFTENWPAPKNLVQQFCGPNRGNIFHRNFDWSHVIIWNLLITLAAECSPPQTMGQQSCGPKRGNAMQLKYCWSFWNVIVCIGIQLLQEKVLQPKMRINRSVDPTEVQFYTGNAVNIYKCNILNCISQYFRRLSTSSKRVSTGMQS